MFAKPDTLADIAVELETDPAPRSPWRVVSVTALPDYRLRVTFRDGLEGVVHMRAAIFSTRAGVFAGLRDEAQFSRVRIERGAPVWPGQIDIAPDAIYDGVRSCGGRAYQLGDALDLSDLRSD